MKMKNVVEVSGNGKKDVKLTHTRMVESYGAPKIESVIIQIEGITSFLANRKTEAMQLGIIKNVTGEKGKRQIVDPDERWKQAQYLNEGGQPCIPSKMFKASMLNTFVFWSDKSFKRKLNGGVFTTKELLPITCSNMDNPTNKRVDVLPLPGGRGMNPSYRREYRDWSVSLPIQFNSDVFSAKEIVSILNTAGFSVGVGDNRPEKRGIFGRFKVK